MTTKKNQFDISSRLHRLFFIVLAISATTPIFGQHTIEGRVIDANGAPLTYANVVLLNAADSTLEYFDVADKLGRWEIKNISPNNYIIQYSFVSMKIIQENITIPSEVGEDFGDKIMQTASVDEIVVTAEYVPISFDQDTVSFNAKAFKTQVGDVVEDLLKKIPGIEVDKAGNIKALGEDVTKILVDGKEFFGNDLKVVTKNLPAKSIAKVQVYDRKSDEAEFMGIDDGVRDRTINLMLNEENRTGYFGNGDAGGGSGNHYTAQGRLYRFSSKIQGALLGMTNNVNQFNFTGRNLGQFGREITGLNTTLAGGLNMSYNKSRFNRYFMSYLFNSTQTILEQDTKSTRYLSVGSYDQNEDLDRDERDTPHKTNFGVRHRFNENHNLIVNGDMNISSNNSADKVLTDTQQNSVPANYLDNSSNTESSLSNLRLNIVDILKLRGSKTQLKTNLNISYNKNTSGSDWTDITTIYNPLSVTTSELYQDNNTDNLSLSVNPTLVLKIRPLWYLNANARIGSNTNNLSRTHGIVLGTNTAIDSLSGDFGTTESFINPSLSLQRNTERVQLNIIFGTSFIQFDKVLDSGSSGATDYFYFLPGFFYTNRYEKGRRIHLRYNSSANMPSLTQLLPIMNTVNQFAVYEGNADLTPEVRHNVSLMWSVFDQFSFTTLFTRLRVGYTKDRISTSQTIDAQFTNTIKPVNVPYYYSASSNIYFSTPVRALGIQINARNNESWSKGISVINSEDNIQNSITHTLDLNIENRKQDKFEIRVGGSISMTDVKSSITADNVYYNTSYYTDLRFTPNEQWSFETEASIVNYSAQSFDEAVEIPIIDASIDYNFSGGSKSTITIKALDLLNKNIGFRRTSSDNYLMERQWNTLGRYVMLIYTQRIGN